MPDSVNSDETYEYTLTARRVNAVEGVHDVTVTVWNKPDIDIDCPGNPYSEYEGEGNIVLACSATGAPEGSTHDYTWTARGTTSNTNKLIAGTNGPTPTFDVPEEVNSDETYEYTLTVSAKNAEDDAFDITVEVLKKVPLTLVCSSPLPVYEGAEDFDLDCVASGAPQDSEYDYVWTGRGSTVVPGRLSSTTIAKPTFDVPGSVNADTDYEYTLTVSARGADTETANVTVRVLNTPSLALVCTPVAPVYEGAEDFDLDCVASGAPQGSEYDYVWTGRGSTVVPGRLSSTTIAKPTFDVPGSVNSNEIYEYTLTVSAENAEDASVPVTVTVLNKPSITVTCPGHPYSAYEGEGDILLDCEATGKPSDSEYDYVWTGRGSTVVPGRLSSTTIAQPTFEVPGSITSEETYEYTLTVSAKNAEDDAFDITVEVLKKVPLTLVCSSPLPVYEGAEDFDLDCVASGAPQDSEYDYVWTGRGSTVVPGRLSSTTIAKPTFDVPRNVNADTDYEYTLTVSARGADTETANVTVRVLNTPSLALVCTPVAPVYEGAEDFDLDCVASGAPQGSEYDYVWTPRGSTVVPGRLSSTTIAKPTFDVPGTVNSNEIYEYTLTASAENAGNATANVTVRVLNTPSLTLVCTPPAPVYEGAADFDLDCVASGAPQGSEYDYVWTGRGSTVVPGRLSSTTIAKPTFDVPGSVNSNEIYEYTLTASAENAEDASANVTVRVLNKAPLALICTPVAPVYEGSEDFDLDCSASGAPQGSEYDYVWTPRGSTVVPGRLSSTTIAKPTFDVPAV